MDAHTAVRIAASPVFVGREAELAEVVRAARAADGGSPRAVLIRGEAGVGKTLLVEELPRSQRPEATVVAVGGCVEVGAEGIPFVVLSLEGDRISAIARFGGGSLFPLSGMPGTLRDQ